MGGIYCASWELFYTGIYMRVDLGNHLYDCNRLGMKPFVLSLLAGVWFIVLNILNACTQPPAEVVYKYHATPQARVTHTASPEADIPIVQNAPVQSITQSDLPPLAVKSTPTAAITPPVQKQPVTEVKPADPSITELIETGERLTLGSGPTPSVQVPTASAPLHVSTFIWPVRGEVISAFGAKPGGLRNDGITIAAAEGTPVQAVADGEVLYTNNAVKGYGNLMLIRHNNGWVSTYAHNKSIAVTSGETIKQGDIVAYVGKTGNVASPQLHFSLRKNKKPVNPTRYLETNLAQKK